MNMRKIGIEVISFFADALLDIIIPELWLGALDRGGARLGVLVKVL